mmetsp:Transcript_56141/g.180174  ORF Transcript_56141/g.180174 Transcript_56141/m.180174 type:complete len:293 (+) Transcript_56141:81-959(+)
MQPWFAALVLSVLMCFTLTCYFFQIPDGLRRAGRPGRWGLPNAEFNWCEPDYQWVDWMAEPVNTISSASLVALPCFFLAFHDASRDATIMAVLLIAIGVGSILFHASLRYLMQLFDELPMLWYSLMGASSLLWRLRGMDLKRPAVACAAALTSGALLTEQHSALHEVCRGLMSCTFSGCLVVMGWGSTSLVVRLKEAEGKRRHVSVAAERIHTVGFLMFVLSVMCWLADNYFCPALWRLPWGLPYPHLHTWWHLLVAAAMYGFLVLFHLDDRRSSQALRVHFRLGLLPVASD